MGYTWFCESCSCSCLALQTPTNFIKISDLCDIDMSPSRGSFSIPSPENNGVVFEAGGALDRRVSPRYSPRMGNWSGERERETVRQRGRERERERERELALPSLLVVDRGGGNGRAKAGGCA